MSSDGNIYIPNAQLMIGAFHAWKNARYFLELSKGLHKDKKFQAAIPYGTISLEESLKGIELVNRFRRKQNMTKEEWSKMKTHKHKLTHVKEEAAEIMEKATKNKEEETVKELEESGFPVPQVNKQKLIEITRRSAHIHLQFQNLRETCLYTDWSEVESDWTVFSSLSEDRQDALAFFVMSEAENELELLEFFIEKMVNKLRNDGILTEPVPYPPYPEYRTVEKFESIKNMNKTRSKAEQIKFSQGLLTMQKFITLNSFENISFGVFSDSMRKYLKLIEKQDDDKWFPHPMIKAMMLALEAARKGDKDGNYSGISGDADLAHDGKPFMVVIVVVNRKEETFSIEKIALVGHDDYAFPLDMIEKILRTELILEREVGKEISIPTLIESFSVVGIKAKMIKEEEIEDAINYTKKIVSEGHLNNASPEITNEIRNIKGKEAWDNLRTETRSIIAVTYGSSKYEGYNMFFTPVKSSEKYKARLTIMSALQSEYLDTA